MNNILFYLIYIYKITTSIITFFININRNAIQEYSIAWNKGYKQVIRKIVVVTVLPSLCLCFTADQVFSMHNNPAFDGEGEDLGPVFEDITFLGSSGQEERTSHTTGSASHSPEGKCQQCQQLFFSCLNGDYWRAEGRNEKVVLCSHIGCCMCLGAVGGGVIGACLKGGGALLMPTLQGMGIGCVVGCPLGTVGGPLSYGCERSYTLLKNEEELEGTPQERNSSVITSQPQAVGSSGVCSSHTGGSDDEPSCSHQYKDTSCFAQGYNSGGQLSSLLGMQCVLMGSSENVLNSLKFLALKAYQGTFEKDTSSSIRSGWKTHLKKRYNQIQVSKNSHQQSMKHIIPVRTFASMDIHEANLEHKGGASRVGVMMDCTSNIAIGLAYTCYKDTTKAMNGMQIGSGVGSVKSRSATENLAAVIALNPDKAGFTGHLVGSYGWGKAKTNRTAIHNGMETSSRGTPGVTLSGSLIQLGYNILVATQLTLIPYVETMVAAVKWNSYQEHAGMLPCNISSNKEKVWEHSVGLRSDWNVSSNTQVQTWVAAVSGNQNIASLSSKPMGLPVEQYKMTAPSHRKKYTKAEIGIGYTTNITDALQIALNGKAHISNQKTSGTKIMNLVMQYIY